MQKRHAYAPQMRPSLPFAMLVVLFGALWLAGGASISSAEGQAIVRLVSAALIVLAVLFCDRPAFAAGRAPFWFLLACAGLAAVQLIPMPPTMWQALPGRELIAQAAAIEGQGQIWRPWSIVPSMTSNALFSLLVPAAALLLLMLLTERERRYLPGLMLIFIVAATLVGLLQFSGTRISNPFINQSYEVSGPFANRNHLALLMACGCLVAPVWAALGRGWRGPAAIGLVLLFVLTALASGSRAGFALSLLSLPIAMLLVRGRFRKVLGRLPRWGRGALIAALILLVVALVTFAIAADRGESIARAQFLNMAEDLRVRTWPYTLDLLSMYFPFGAGMGSFDTVFRMNEPLSLLDRTYFNHAHNDFLEVAIDGGFLGIVLVAVALVWWGFATLRVWRMGPATSFLMPKLGSAVLFLVLLGAIVDFAARTPIMMAVIAVAAFWLNLGTIATGSEEADPQARS